MHACGEFIVRDRGDSERPKAPRDDHLLARSIAAAVAVELGVKWCVLKAAQKSENSACVVRYVCNFRIKTIKPVLHSFTFMS